MAFLFIVAYPEVSRRLVLVRTGRGAAGAWRAGGVGWDEAPLGTAAPKTLRPGRKLSVGRSGKSRAAVPLPPGWGAWALTTREQPPGEPQTGYEGISFPPQSQKKVWGTIFYIQWVHVTGPCLTGWYMGIEKGHMT